MRGLILPVLERKRFDWTYLGGGGQQQVVLQPAIDVTGFYYIQLWVRIHERSFSADQTVGMTLFETLPSNDDPREFTITSSSFLSLSFNLGSPVSVPALLNANSTNPGAFLKLVLSAYQAATAPGTFYAELSAVLVLREV